MKVATHSGRFHADDVFAIATLKLAGSLTELIRTRDEAVLAQSDLRVDVGRKYAPGEGDFDHHQPDGAGRRENGVPYASFGLIWRQYGEQVSGSAEAAARIDAELVQQIDADDVGHDIFTAQLPSVRPYTVSKIISGFNPSWTSDPTPGDMDQRFGRAVELALMLLKRAITEAHEQLEAQVLVRRALQTAADPQVIMLERHAPWRQTVIAEAPGALYVVSPVWPAVRHQWSVEAVNRRLDAFEARKPLPRAWAGKVGAELAVASSVADAVFCHAARFLAIAESKEGALRLAKLACEW